MGIRVVTPPASEPVTLTEAKTHMNVVGTADDTYISTLIVAGREYCEGFQARAHVTQTLELTLDAFPSERYVELPRPPLQSVTSVVYKDDDGIDTTFAASNYAVDTKSFVGKIVLMPSASWPSFDPYPVNAVSITYVAGYGAASTVPAHVKQAMLLLIGHWYENRETILIGTVSKQLEFTVSSLLAMRRVL